MTEKVAVFGNLNYLDVWNNQRFLARLKAQQFTEEDHQVLGDLGI